MPKKARCTDCRLRKLLRDGKRCFKCWSAANPTKGRSSHQANTESMEELELRIAANAATMPGKANRQGDGSPAANPRSTIRVFG